MFQFRPGTSAEDRERIIRLARRRYRWAEVQWLVLLALATSPGLVVAYFVNQWAGDGPAFVVGMLCAGALAAVVIKFQGSLINDLAVLSLVKGAEPRGTRLCAECRYDLRGSPGGYCPECGFPILRVYLTRCPAAKPWARLRRGR